MNLPGGGEVRGETTVPASPTLLQPGEGARFVALAPPGANGAYAETDSVRVAWTSSVPDALVALRLVAADAYLADQPVPDARCFAYLVDGNSALVGAPQAADSILGSVVISGCHRRTGPASSEPLRPDSVAADFLLAAFDPAFSAYAEALSNDVVRERRAAAGITGAFGVFGSAAPDRRRVLFVIRDR